MISDKAINADAKVRLNAEQGPCEHEVAADGHLGWHQVSNRLNTLCKVWLRQTVGLRA